MLAARYKFGIRNDTGQILAADDVKIYCQGWKYASGDVSYGTTAEEYSNASLATATEVNSSEIDNSTDLYLGLNCELVIDTSVANLDGTVTVFYKPMTATARGATDGEGRPVCSIFLDATGTFRRSFEIVGDA